MIWVMALVLVIPSVAFSACSLQALVNSATAGSTVKVPCGTYREQVTINKAMTLDGQNCVTVKGSDQWNTGWTGTGPWTHTGLPTLPEVLGECTGSDTAPCNWPAQVFFDGVPLQEVNTTPTTGQFQATGGSIIVGSNPSGYDVEVTVRWDMFVVSSSNVTIKNFTMKHLATAVYQAAIIQLGGNFSNLTVDNVDISYIHTQAIAVSGSSNWIIKNSRLYLNGQHGLAGGGSGITNLSLINNVIHDNNTEDFDPGVSAGGVKVTLANGVLFQGNTVYDNEGEGLWCDVGCVNVSYIDNIIYGNKHQGIFYEISDGCIIAGNKLWNNGWGFYAWCYGANIVISSSSTCDIYNNIVAWGPKSIVALSQDRQPYNPAMTGIHIHDNVMVQDTLITDTWFTGWCQDWPTPDPIYGAPADNVGANNRFWITGETDAVAFGWNNSLMTLSNCNATACGSGTNSYLTATEKNTILSGAGIPTTPPAHP